MPPSTFTTSPQPELLLPAGDPQKLRYALAYGADAVYLGLPMASLRTPSRGEQFTPENLGSHIQYVQQHGKKAYVTINIFPSNRDLDRIAPHLELLETLKPDAIIYSDPGVYRLAKRYAPSVPLHLSTQANTLNVEACAFWQDLGVERVILAREVPLREIAEIHEKLPTLELECFVHGSLCVAYSGRCVISDYLTDQTKNSNKGMCGNSCRWEFEEANRPDGTAIKSLEMREASRPHDVYTFEEDDKGTYMLNSKDLCLIRHLKKLQQAGIVSFKVEGRTKSLFYVATVGRVYREAMAYFSNHDEDPSEELMARWVFEAMQAGNRGFTEGFLSGRPGHDAYSYETSQSQQGSLFVGTVLADRQLLPDGSVQGVKIQARNPFRVGEPLEWMTPEGVVSFPLEVMWDETGLPKQELQTNQIAIVQPPAGLSPEGIPWSLIRRKERQPVAC